MLFPDSFPSFTKQPKVPAGDFHGNESTHPRHDTGFFSDVGESNWWRDPDEAFVVGPAEWTEVAALAFAEFGVPVFTHF